MATQKKSTWGGRREGAGRPPAFRNPVDRFIRFERSDVRVAETLARKRGVSFPEIVREALHQYVKREKAR